MSSWMERREPALADDRAIAGPSQEELQFLQQSRERSLRAGWLLWVGAAASLALLVAVILAFALKSEATAAYRFGQVAAALFWPLLAVGVAKLLKQERSQRALVLVFVITCLVMSAFTVLTTAQQRGSLQRLLHKEKLTAQDYLAQAHRCQRDQDLPCQEEAWRDYTALRPTDATGPANLGMVLNRLDRHTEAVEQFQKALALGEGAYDLFAYHADSLEKLGQIEPAIDWNYKALSIVPNLVDVRGKLAKLLVAAKRPYEALSLLQAYDSQMEARGQPAYFTGQRIAITSTLEQDPAPTSTERKALRLPHYAGHYFAPVTLGSAKPVPFMVDTGATRTTLSEKLLADSHARYRVTQADVQMLTADGRKVSTRAITIESMAIGRFQLNNVLALVCRDCSPLLGQSTLSGFDMQSSKVGGVESLVLTPR